MSAEEELRAFTDREGTIRTALVTSLALPCRCPGAADLGPALDQARQRLPQDSEPEAQVQGPAPPLTSVRLEGEAPGCQFPVAPQPGVPSLTGAFAALWWPQGGLLGSLEAASPWSSWLVGGFL